jgi:hypothetical protein
LIRKRTRRRILMLGRSSRTRRRRKLRQLKTIQTRRKQARATRRRNRKQKQRKRIKQRVNNPNSLQNKHYLQFHLQTSLLVSSDWRE